MTFLKLFLDSADPEKIRRALDFYPIDGVTTNPTILSRQNTELLPLLKELRKITEGRLLFVQVTAEKSDDMVREAHMIADRLGGDLCIKIPATEEGLRAIKILSRDGISTTATAVYSVSQAILAAAAGADYVAPYMSHIDNLCLDSAQVAGDMAKLFREHYPKTNVLAASFRVAEQINRAVLCGVGAVTVAPEMLPVMIGNRGTEAELESFEKNWSSVYGDKSVGDLI